MGICNSQEVRKQMYRFFADASQINGNEFVIEGQDAHHIKNVLRMKKGDNICISCGDEWEYTCQISGFEDKKVVARILDVQKTGRELPSKITLYQCLPKKDKMELIIQKSVELGVYRIVPVMSSRCIAKINPGKSADKTERWNSISKAAAKQAKRLIEPEVAPAVSFDEALFEITKNDVSVIPYECAEGIGSTRRLFESIIPGQSIGIIIGPEGGFDETEVKKASDAGVIPVTLGNRILRTETAGPAVLSILMYLLEQE
jgi:16S rRNA (uracil1498-N3)-methyltransferase